MGPGQPVTFYWSVRPLDKGNFKGTAWLFLRFVDRLTGEESQRAISAQTVEISTADLYGFSGGLRARTTGAIGSVIGGIIGIPFFEDIVKFLFSPPPESVKSTRKRSPAAEKCPNLETGQMG